MSKKLLIATRRKGKLDEFKEILKKLRFQLLTLEDINFPNIECTIPFAAAFGALGSLMLRATPVVTGISAATLSFLPWFKYKYPNELRKLQEASK